MYAALLACMSVPQVCVWSSWRPEEGMGSLELELPTVVGYHVDAGNETLIFWESNRCS